ncbi:vacuolar protein sorting-associated protein 11 homolog isoform X1 [Neodiprion fabricii]|uniref:vacuolar protein sorting-associated protein 11 homolog isoform X1 n=1 Tax=Neodiprion fabricii TaxID=2872261 RepID=UPI001ED96F90|nr:vacuolar protein sorting-associated protein 11 homolog isoform X1 [Neodiprion fabricii]
MMAFLEWRRFNFFDLKKEVDSGKISEALGEAQVTAATSGNGDLVFGDNTGNVHLVNRKYVITTFRAYEITLTLAQQVQHSTFLFTIGEDEPGCNPTIKVWNLAKLDKHGNPTCVRISRAVPGYRAVPASALCVHSGLTLMAVGFGDGSIMLYRGDLTRERKNKIRILKDSNTPVTGLAIRSTGKQTHMFVATTTSVFLYNITVKDKEYKTSLDNMGCSRKCSVLADSTQGSHFMIGRNDAVYCYTPDGRGPCYAVDGQKIMLEWFRSYLVIIAKEAANVPRTTTICAKPNTIEPIPPGADKHTITVLDIQNKVIVFSAPMLSVQAVLSEWGGFFILSGNSKLYHLDEKDLQSKLTLLFKKNLYDVSIRIAKSQQYDAEGLVDIFRQYGDHLYSKGDHNGAIEQYIKTIGKLEPSYVIRKFLDSQHIDNLTTYLQALHKQGQATGDHTTLLLNCYTKLNHTEKLKEFIMTKDREVDFDVEIAIKVCRQASSEDALLLATKHGKHEWFLRIQIEDKAEYKGALEYIATLDFEEAESNMKKYGSVLIEHVPNEATQFLKRLCTNYRPANKPLVDQATLDGSVEQSIEKANPEEFIHLFLGNSERLVEFLEHLVKCESKWSTLVYNTLVEHYLHVWSALGSEVAKLQYEQKVVRLLQSSEASYDKDQILILCQQHNFRRGILFLYEERKLYQEILQYHLREGDNEQILATCKRFGHQDPNLWVQALWSVARNKNASSKLLADILTYIAKEKLLSPLMVVDALSTSMSCTLGDVRNYLNNVLRTENEQTQADTDLTKKYQADTQKLREQIESIKNNTIIFQGSRCSACHDQLELPSVHFMCQHSYHQHCFQSFSENENECPACLPNNKKLLDIIKAQEQSRDLHETFHSLLDRAEDPFSLVADYFGRGVFKKLTVITDADKPQALPSSKFQEPKPKFQEPKPNYYAYGAGAEAKLRLGEGRNTNLVTLEPRYVGSDTPSNVVIPIPEGRLRVLAKPDIYSSSFDTSLSGPTSGTSTPRSSRKGSPILIREARILNISSPKMSPAQKTFIPPKTPIVPLNPFTGDGYDESKNPFAEDNNTAEDDPFQEDDDYDKNLNPFAS